MRKNRYSNDGIESIKSHLNYDKETGVFTWIADRKRVKQGDVAGSKDKDGYLVICFNGKSYKAHRLAWLFVHGFFPADTIDHKNRNRQDNRISNLRVATRFEQMHNLSKSKSNASGFPGVFWSSKNKKWQAQITINRKRHHVGMFDDPTEANAKRIEMKSALLRSL